MKKLTPVDLSRLHYAEFGQFIVLFIEDFSDSNLNTDTDADFKRMFDNIQAQILHYTSTLDHIKTSQESVKIAEADAVRNTDLQVLKDAVKPYRYAKTQAEKNAYSAIKVLLSQYRDIQHASYEEETNRLNMLVEKLLSSEYSFHVSALSIVKFANHLSDSNAAFNSIFSKCSFGIQHKQASEVKALRRNLTHDYKQMANYIATLANVKDDVFYKDALAILNKGRAHFSRFVSMRRNGRNKQSITITN
ncbi:DUF6261 family protein [Chryseobacterium daeguense]|uniref:DUF6261 family protein n=1 Tax=Chryseobacterium daeguense TaxID=412438 RepID=UPI000427B15F|nr:DUF6261 family protein [Chryseobacterium daeguense]